MHASKQVMVKITTSDKPGTMAKVFSDIARLGVNIPAFIAWSEAGKGEFRLLSDDSAKLAEILKDSGYIPEMEDAVVVKAENKAGAAWAIGKKLSDAGVNIRKAFATSGSLGEGMVVLLTDDNKKAIKALV